MGGKVFKDDISVVNRDDVELILKEIYRDNIPYTSVIVVLGGGLVKEYSGDLDIAIKFPDNEDKHVPLKNYFTDYETKKHGSVLSVKYPWKGKFIQLDVEKTDDVEYSKWRKQTHKDEFYTGQTRGILLDTIVKYSNIVEFENNICERWLLSPISGLCRIVLNNSKEHYREFISKDPKEIVKSVLNCFTKYPENYSFDTTQSIIETVEVLFPKSLKKTIFESVIEKYKKRDVVVPLELYKYIEKDTKI